MNRFDYARPASVAEAVQAGDGEQVRYLAGGTNLIDLMKENVERPVTVIDINRLPLNAIEELDGGGLRLGALVPNSDTAWDARVEQRYPLAVVRDPGRGQPAAAQCRDQWRQPQPAHALLLFLRRRHSLQQARAGLGLRRDRRVNRIHAILGASEQCIATHPSDMCVALAVLDATVQVTGPEGDRAIPIADYHRLPGDEPWRDNTLKPGELGDRHRPAGRGLHPKLHLPEAARSSVLCLRAGVDSRRDAGRRRFTIAEARVALGGVAHKPWRARRPRSS